MEVSSHFVIVYALLDFNQRVVELQVESVSLHNHCRKLLLDGNRLMKLLEEFGLGWVSLDLPQNLVKGLHLLLDLVAQLLLFFLKSRVSGVMVFERFLVFCKYFFLGFLVGKSSHEVISSVG